MKKFWLVFKHELRTVIVRRSYIIMLLLIPLLGFGVVFLFGNSGQQSGSSSLINQLVSSAPSQGVEGFVDASGIIKTIPPEQRNRLRPFASEAEALQAYHAGEISAYYLVSKDYVETGDLVYARPDYNPIGGQTDSYGMELTLLYNLVNGDADLMKRLQAPFSLEMTSLKQPEARDPTNMLTFFVPYIVMLLFYIVILSTASLMLNSITTEKQNRVIEIMMTSVTPTEMLAGKIAALGIAGLLQTAVWSGSGLLLMRLGGSVINLPPEFQLPTSLLAWGLVFFILGFILYGSLMAGIGALVPNLREASQATTLVVMPSTLPMFFISAFVEEPNGAIATILSLFPLTSPVAMMTRLSAVNLPVWQPLLAAGLLLITCLLVVRSAAGMFRAQNLLSGQPFSTRVFLRALLGKA